MQAEVTAFLIVNVYFGLAFQMLALGFLWFPVFDRYQVNYAGHLIIPGTGWHALHEFAAVVRNQYPGWMFPAHWMDRDPDAVERTVVRPIGCAEDQPVVFLLLVVIFVAAGGRKSAEQQTGKTYGRRKRRPPRLSNHFPRRPRRRPHPILHLPLLQEGSIQAAF